MNWFKGWTGKATARQERLELRKLEAGETLDAVLEQTLSDFRTSVHAWSEAAYSRPRTFKTTVRHRSWRLAASCAMGCVLVAGGVSGGFHVRQHRQEVARVAAAQAAERARQVAEQRARVDEEDLLAKVDTDVSREVPSAMEPLAQMMADDGTR
jgi:hypothetical protein